jgi:hypothetical protein
MRTSFSPMAEAARRLAAGSGAERSGHSAALMPPGSPAPAEGQWCEWPRTAPSSRPFQSIRQALQAIQARHA